MRFLRRQTLNRRAVYDNAMYVDTTNAVVMGTQNNLTLPIGPTSARPAIPVNGMVRYNSDTGDIEAYQGTAWRSLRYRESGAITLQTLGYGDANTVYFGPLNPAPPTVAQSGYTWSGANLLVLVENVIQIYNTNYTVVQNPSITGQVYASKTSGTTSVGSTTINIDYTTTVIYPALNLIGATVSGPTQIQGATLVSTYSVNANGQLTSISLSKPTITSTIGTATSINITVPTATASGYYLNFSSAIPYGKPAIVLHGFDQ